MFKVYLVQTGQTTWEAQSRLASYAGSPLSAQGAESVTRTAEELARFNGVNAIYSAGSEGETQTAGILAEALRVKIRNSDDLREIHYGLWQGLTTDEIKRRQPKVFRQWREDPTSICPPEGETLEEAQARLIKAIKRVLKKHKSGSAMFVLSPIAAALLRCRCEAGSLESLWKYVSPDCAWFSYELDAGSL